MVSAGKTRAGTAIGKNGVSKQSHDAVHSQIREECSLGFRAVGKQMHSSQVVGGGRPIVPA